MTDSCVVYTLFRLKFYTIYCLYYTQIRIYIPLAYLCTCCVCALFPFSSFEFSEIFYLFKRKRPKISRAHFTWVFQHGQYTAHTHTYTDTKCMGKHQHMQGNLYFYTVRPRTHTHKCTGAKLPLDRSAQIFHKVSIYFRLECWGKFSCEFSASWATWRNALFSEWEPSPKNDREEQE